MKKYITKIRSVFFTFDNGRGWSPELESQETATSAEFNNVYQDHAAKIFDAEDEEDAKKQAIKQLEKETSWIIFKADVSVKEQL